MAQIFKLKRAHEYMGKKIKILKVSKAREKISPIKK